VHRHAPVLKSFLWTTEEDLGQYCEARLEGAELTTQLLWGLPCKMDDDDGTEVSPRMSSTTKFLMCFILSDPQRNLHNYK